jgi:hypothetical protein
MAMPADKNTLHGLGTSQGESFTLDLVKVDAFPRSGRETQGGSLGQSLGQ